MSTLDGSPTQDVSFAPKEHGAYGQLAMPALAALAAGHPTRATLCLLGAAGALFAAHEPLLVIVGRRGSRARRLHGGRARRRILELGALAAVLGSAGLIWATPATRMATLLPAVLAMGVALAIALEAERSTAGEIAAASALAAVAAPLAVSSGVAPSAAFTAWATWAAGFAALTFAVRAIAKQKKNPLSLGARLAPVVGLGLALGVGAAATGTSWAVAAAGAPLFLAALALAIAPPKPTALRPVGWVLMGACLVTTALVAFTLRA